MRFVRQIGIFFFRNCVVNLVWIHRLSIIFYNLLKQETSGCLSLHGCILHAAQLFLVYQNTIIAIMKDFQNKNNGRSMDACVDGSCPSIRPNNDWEYDGRDTRQFLVRWSVITVLISPDVSINTRRTHFVPAKNLGHWLSCGRFGIPNLKCWGVRISQRYLWAGPISIDTCTITLIIITW